jgi:hypothetical protein
MLTLQGSLYIPDATPPKAGHITRQWRNRSISMPPTDNQEKVLIAHFPGKSF